MIITDRKWKSSERRRLETEEYSGELFVENVPRHGRVKQCKGKDTIGGTRQRRKT